MDSPTNARSESSVSVGAGYLLCTQCYRQECFAYIDFYYGSVEKFCVTSTQWASIPKVVGSIPTVAGIFFKLARCG